MDVFLLLNVVRFCNVVQTKLKCLIQRPLVQWRRHGGREGATAPNDFLIIFPNRLEPQSFFFRGLGG